MDEARSLGHHLPLRRSRPPNFDRVARIYRWAEYVCLGPLLTRIRERFLPALVGARLVLALGDGDGRFVARLLRASPQTEIIAVDASGAMLALLRRRCAFAENRLRTVQADFLHLPPALDLSDVDAVVTHFSLDCLSQQALEQLVKQIGKRTDGGALWLLSDFGYPDREPWRSAARVYVRALYLAFRVLTGLHTQRLPEIRRAFESQGLRRVASHQVWKGLLYTELWRLPKPADPLSRPETRATQDSADSST